MCCSIKNWPFAQSILSKVWSKSQAARTDLYHSRKTKKQDPACFEGGDSSTWQQFIRFSEFGKQLWSFPDDITSTNKITFWESLELAIFGIKQYWNPQTFRAQIPSISQVCRSRASHQSPCLALPAATPSLWTGWPELKMMDPVLRYTHCYDPCNYVRFIERRSGNFLEVLHRCWISLLKPSPK